jgi:hypothetical protein
VGSDGAISCDEARMRLAQAWEVFVSDELVGFLRARLDERERIWTERGRAAASAGDSAAIWDAFWHAGDIESKRRIITSTDNVRRARGGSSTLNGFNIATATVLIELARVDMYHPDFNDRWLRPSDIPARDAADRADRQRNGNPKWAWPLATTYARLRSMPPKRCT